MRLPRQAALASVLLLFSALSRGQSGFPEAPLARDSFTRIMKAEQFDECFTEPLIPSADPDDPDEYGVDYGRFGPPPTYCRWWERPNKTNQTYVWSMTKRDDVLWIGTLANGVCIVQIGYGQRTEPFYMRELVICENSYGPNGWDWRPAEIWSLNLRTGEKINWTGFLPEEARLFTMGWRAATTFDGKVFFAGTGTKEDPTMSVLVLDDFGPDGKPSSIEWAKLEGWLTARRFLALNGRLYLGAGTEDTSGPELTSVGSVLRWTGGTTFEEVGVVGVQGMLVSWITYFNERIYAATWLGSNGFEIWKSPPVPPGGGLTPADRLLWQKVWEAGAHEPLNTAGGAMNVLGDHLYFGSMHIPKVTEKDAFDIYRMDKAESVELLIGQAKNGFTPKGVAPCTVPGQLCRTTSDSGFGNDRNAYLWSTTLLTDEEGHEWLVFGTLNFGGLQLWATLDGLQWVPITTRAFPTPLEVWYGNNYGARNVIFDGIDLYVSTATVDNLSAFSGWEVWKAQVGLHRTFVPIVVSESP